MHLEKWAAPYVGVMHIRTRQDAMDDEYIERIRHCDAVMFTGRKSTQAECDRRRHRVPVHFKKAGTRMKIS
jgi:hypothetical protein